MSVSPQIGWRVIGSYITSGSLWLFLLTVVSHLGLIGSQAMANIWLCMWTDTEHCSVPSAWLGGHNQTDMPVPKKLEVYGIIGIIQGGLVQSVNINHFQIESNCQARKLNKEDAVDRCKWRKLIKDV